MAKNKNSMLVTLAAVALIVIAAVAVYSIFFQTSQNATGGQSSTGEPIGGTYISTGSTALRYASSDAITGSAVTAVTQTRTGDAGPYLLGITTASPGDKLSVLLNASGYHPIVLSYTVPTAPTSTQPVKMDAYGTVTIDAFNTDNVKMANAGAGVNQTASIGGVYNLKIRFTGASNKNSGPMRCILEGEVGTNISKIELSGLGAVKSTAGKPNSYSLLSSGSSVWIYDVAPVVGAATPEGNLVVTSNTGKTVAGSRVKVACLSIENFIDPNSGLIVQGVEDSNGVAQSLVTPSTSFYFN